MERIKSFILSCFKLNSALISVCVLTNLFIICDCSIRPNSDRLPPSIINVSMPNVRPVKDDDYYCTAMDIQSYGTQYIHEFEPNSDADRAHHMLLFACDDVDDSLTKNGWWDCGHHYQACRTMRIIYAWAKNAPPTVLPKDVGLRIGAESNIKYLVLQVHYAHAMPEGSKDESGFTIHISPEEPKYLAGVMILFRSYLSIPAHQEKIHGDSNCQLQANRPIHPFAYRVHTHKLGVVVSGYIFNETSGFRDLAKGNPQWPQAFYPMKGEHVINPKEYVLARCTFSTTNFDRNTRIGQTAGDEMCNLYIMYYTDSRDPEEHYIDCGDEEQTELNKYLPPGSDVPLPRNATLEEHAKGHLMDHSLHAEVANPVPPGLDALNVKKKNHAKKRPGIELPSEPHQDISIEDSYLSASGRLDAGRAMKASSEYKFISNWPNPNIKFGQVSGVDFDTTGNVVVFHRGDRIWGARTFNMKDVFQERSLGPIKTDTVYVLNPKTGEVLHHWGKDLFYMPHDITVAPNGDTFLTDVALHQVFKFEPGSTKPSLVLGTAFEPGKDDRHFCKPSAVAVLSNGDFFVADGYCNTRIIKYTKDGKKIFEIGRPFTPSILQRFSNARPPPFAFSVPHALALGEEKDLLCIADRENGRIQCVQASDGSMLFIVENQLFDGNVYSVAYSSINDGTLFAVNGRRNSGKIQGFVIPLKTANLGVISSVFSPPEGFGNPHDIAVTKNGSSVYVTEIRQPYRVCKFERMEQIRTGKNDNVPITSYVQSPSNINSQPNEPQRRVDPTPPPALPSLPNETQPKNADSPVAEDSFSSSVIIMAFLTIPLLLLIGVGACLRIRSNGCCKRAKETKSFAEFFPPSAGFEKLRMDESESDNSDTEVEEFTVSSYRKANA